MCFKNLKKIFVAFMAIALIIVSFSNCKKDDGLSKSDMLITTWNISNWYWSSTDGIVTLIPNNDGISIELEFEDNNAFTFTAFGSGGSAELYTGIWSINDDETVLTLNYDQFK